LSEVVPEVVSRLRFATPPDSTTWVPIWKAVCATVSIETPAL
jgi:hypothetical protein